MPELTRSLLTNLPEHLIDPVDSVPVAVPSRLALNNRLREELSLCKEWFYDRTFPMWAAGKATGISLASAQQPKAHASRNAMVIGGIVDKMHYQRDVQLLTANTARAPAANNHCVYLPSAVIETVVSEFCNHIGISSAAVLCVISDNLRTREESTKPCTLISKTAFSFLSLGHLIEFLRGNPQLRGSLSSLCADIVSNAGIPIPARGGDKAILNTLYDIALYSAARRQACGVYISELSAFDLLLCGEMNSFEHCGFIERLSGNIRLYSGGCAPTELFDAQPRAVIEILLDLADAFDGASTGGYSALDLRSRLTKRYDFFFHTAVAEKLNIAPLQAESSDLISDALSIIREEDVNYWQLFYHLRNTKDRGKLTSLFNDAPAFTLWYERYKKAQEFSPKDTLSPDCPPLRNPQAPVLLDDIDVVIQAIANGNRNALENFLESLQVGRVPSVSHWAS